MYVRWSNHSKPTISGFRYKNPIPVRVYCQKMEMNLTRDLLCDLYLDLLSVNMVPQ